MKYTFDLVTQPWIPAMTHKNKLVLISLREALVNARVYQCISSPLPHSNAAVLRLLLAVLHRVFGPSSPDAWEEIWRSGTFDPKALDDYFVRHPYFDLFSSERPFFQRRHPLVEEKPAQVLLQLVGGGDTFTLFDHVLDETPFSLSPAEASLALITLQTFGLAGLCHPQHKLVYTDAPCSRAAVFFVEGDNLFETLMYNLIRYNRENPFSWNRVTGDRPAWETDDPYSPQRSVPLGYLDYLTWPNRKITLHPEEINGEIRVTRITTAPGLTLAAEVHNPMYHYRQDLQARGNAVVWKVLRFSESRALWRDSHALLELHTAAVEPPRALDWMRELVNHGILPGDGHIQISAYGMCTEPGKQKVYFYRGERIEISEKLLKNPELVNKLGDALKHAEKLRNELWVTLNQLATHMISFTVKDHKPDPKDIKNLIQHWDAEGIYWSRLEVPFYRLLNSLPDNSEEALRDWNGELRKSVWAAYLQTAGGLGDSQNAMKAAALTRGRMSFGVEKVLGAPALEDK